MRKKRKIASLGEVSETELGLLFEIKMLDAAGLLGPVLDTVASGLEALYVESERRATVEREAKSRATSASTLVHVRAMSRAFQKGYIPIQFKPDNLFLRKLIEEKTAAGQWLGRLDYERRVEIRRAFHEEVVSKARQAAVNSCRAYVGATS